MNTIDTITESLRKRLEEKYGHCQANRWPLEIHFHIETEYHQSNPIQDKVMMKEIWNMAIEQAAKRAKLNLGDERGTAEECTATDEFLHDFGVTVDQQSILDLKIK